MMKLLAWFVKKWKVWALLAGIGVVGAVSLIFWSRGEISRSAADRLFTTEAEMPDCEVALVLGCVRYLANGRENLYFNYRIDAVVELWEAGKIRRVLVSGDNSRKDYDEATDMKDALVARGLPAERIHCDFAGFRTLDSVVRARDVFQLDRFVVVSQQFHVERALYLAQELGIDAYGYAARDVAGRGGARTRAREQLARVKAVLDVNVFRTQPKFRGEPVPIRAKDS